ncbi:MAG: hypothetical protein LBK95_13685 [Bifidobacteriaceae bacterium]|jgi:hypothetical protein|nr:hypothetical protein [Bifidobacteriaceae bacterium]
MSDIQVAASAAYKRQFRKLKSPSLKAAAQRCAEDIYELVALRRSGAGHATTAETIIRRRRIKAIQRFRHLTPKRFEATFAPDGRIVWAVSGNRLEFIYLGTHAVLDQD